MELPSANVAVELLQQLIRNRCVNNDDVASGCEVRSVSTLMDFLDHPRIEREVFEPVPGRQSLVATIRGTDANAPSLGLNGHVDVVSAVPEDWTHGPFDGDLVDGWVWGRGAIDMLYLTASMAVAFRQLATEGFAPRGNLVFMAVADEESGGALGSGWLVDNVPEKVLTTYLLTEWGGVPIASHDGPKLWLTVGQKGGTQLRLRFRGRSSHASMPYDTENALKKAAVAVQRLHAYQPKPMITDSWREHVVAMRYEDELQQALLDVSRIDAALQALPPAIAARAHACTRMTMVPTIIRGDMKINVVPSAVDLGVLVRRLPEHTFDDAMTAIREALGDLWDEVDCEVIFDVEPTISSADTPLWQAVSDVAKELVPDSTCVQAITPGGNDGGYFRQRGTIVYGFGLTSPMLSIDQYVAMLHGVDERIDTESIDLSVQLWYRTAKRVLA